MFFIAGDSLAIVLEVLRADHRALVVEVYVTLRALNETFSFYRVPILVLRADWDDRDDRVVRGVKLN